jgi:hypothetical protein
MVGIRTFCRHLILVKLVLFFAWKAVKPPSSSKLHFSQTSLGTVDLKEMICGPFSFALTFHRAASQVLSGLDARDEMSLGGRCRLWAVHDLPTSSSSSLSTLSSPGQGNRLEPGLLVCAVAWKYSEWPRTRCGRDRVMRQASARRAESAPGHRSHRESAISGLRGPSSSRIPSTGCTLRLRFQIRR